jgi:hypothetical protein
MPNVFNGVNGSTSISMSGFLTILTGIMSWKIDMKDLGLRFSWSRFSGYQEMSPHQRYCTDRWLHIGISSCPLQLNFDSRTIRMAVQCQIQPYSLGIDSSIHTAFEGGHKFMSQKGLHNPRAKMQHDPSTHAFSNFEVYVHRQDQ